MMTSCERTDIHEKQQLSEMLNRKFIRWRNINRRVDRALLCILLLVTGIVCSALLDNLVFLERGIHGVRYHDFNTLLQINPDTVAWLMVDGTKIDHPVVQGRDNFEYLDLAFTGEYYSGGSLFLDCENRKDFSDSYNMIHGHNMAGGAMFGDLELFTEEGFFRSHSSGRLMTPSWDYDLRILAAGRFDAYDGTVYAAGGGIPKKVIRDRCVHTRKNELKKEQKVLALSTCSGAMNNERIVVFCEMTNKRKHE